MKEAEVCHFLGEYMEPAAHSEAALGGKAAKPAWEQGWFSIPATPAPMQGESGRLGGSSMGTKLRTIYLWQFA